MALSLFQLIVIFSPRLASGSLCCLFVSGINSHCFKWNNILLNEIRNFFQLGLSCGGFYLFTFFSFFFIIIAWKCDPSSDINGSDIKCPRFEQACFSCPGSIVQLDCTLYLTYKVPKCKWAEESCVWKEESEILQEANWRCWQFLCTACISWHFISSSTWMCTIFWGKLCTITGSNFRLSTCLCQKSLKMCQVASLWPSTLKVSSKPILQVLGDEWFNLLNFSYSTMLADECYTLLALACNCIEGCNTILGCVPYCEECCL